MATPAHLDEIDTAVQELRVEAHGAAFKDTLRRIVSALGTIPDSAPGQFRVAELERLRELADETIDAIERRIDSGGDDLDVQQHLAGTVYEIRRRMEAVEIWFRPSRTNPES
jgi:hypothetical protein